MTNKNLVDRDPEKGGPPNKSDDYNTYKKHSLEYFTKKGVLLRTGLDDVALWYVLCIRELLDNAADFLTKNYKGADNTIIATTITKDDKLFRVKIRNSNYKNITVLENKKAILDYDMRFGSKQYLHIISRGMLGDALKQILAFGYTLLHLNDDGNSFQAKQWEHPLFVRHNGKEFEIYLTVDTAKQKWDVRIDKTKDIDHTDTEIEFLLPMVEEARNLNRTKIEEYCREYPLFTTDITFRFNITDNSTVQLETNDSELEPAESEDIAIGNALVTALTKPAPRATIHIEYKALHPISEEPWNKQNSIRAYTLDEFWSRFVHMPTEEAVETRVYDLLKTYRECSNLGKQPEHEISIVELCELPDKERDKKIELFYKQLWEALPAPPKLILPYTSNKEKRKSILTGRLSRRYDNLDKDRKKASYKSIYDTYEDKKRHISFPYFFEILAVPFDNPASAKNGIVFVGAVNYSISPREDSNLFDSDKYKGNFPNTYSGVKNILGVLDSFGFHRYAVDSAKIPCLIVANLVTPRRDPHGYDKSSIDVSPFSSTIITAAKRLASDIKTYRGINMTFSSPKERYSARPETNKKGALERVLTRYLQEHYDLPREPIN